MFGVLILLSKFGDGEAIHGIALKVLPVILAAPQMVKYGASITKIISSAGTAVVGQKWKEH